MNFVLSYNQPTADKHGKTVAGTTWYAAKRPGDGGVDWEYTKEANQAGVFSEHWRRRWFKLHGSRANATEVVTKPPVKVSSLDLATLKMSIEEHVRYSYMPALRRCVDAGLVVFGDNGRGSPILTDAGRKALAAEFL